MYIMILMITNKNNTAVLIGILVWAMSNPNEPNSINKEAV